jgi:hypothetical protein
MVGFTVGIVSLVVQTRMLYPFHHQLDDELADVKARVEAELELHEEMLGNATHRSSRAGGPENKLSHTARAP